MKKASLPFTARVLGILLGASLVSVSLLLVRMVSAGNTRFWFMLWNLFLAWLPLLFALGLRTNLGKNSLSHWQNLLLFFVWLGFLPNSFYIMSDFIHLQSSGEASILYDIAMMSSFVINGLILGYLSVWLVHRLLLERFRMRYAHGIVALVFLASGFAIYLGRFLRWNTWDILFNPAGLLFDLSERIINPLTHSQTYIVTLVFFLVISSTYAIIYELTRTLEQYKAK
jgi:uncharacterized membrane protein